MWEPAEEAAMREWWEGETMEAAASQQRMEAHRGKWGTSASCWRRRASERDTMGVSTALDTSSTAGHVCCNIPWL